MILSRIDNVFYNTENVELLSQSYSNMLGIPIRREQTEGPGLMWVEIPIGGMELSFRKVNGINNVHSNKIKGQFELPPGNGATISFEVMDMQKSRKALEDKGIKFSSDIIPCSEGKELISIFEDSFGRPVQLYQANFESETAAMSTAGRVSSFAFMPKESLASNNIKVGSNLRTIQDMAYSVAFTVDDLDKAEDFYCNKLELTAVFKSKNKLITEIDGAFIEFRKYNSRESFTSNSGAILCLEVNNIVNAKKFLNIRGINVKDEHSSRSGLNWSLYKKLDKRVSFLDPDQNKIEIFESKR